MQAAAAKIFSCNYSGTRKLNKGCKKPGQTAAAAFCCFVFPSYLAFKVYKGKKPSKDKGIQRWLKGEEWIKVEPYVKDGKVVKCGTGDKHACRPLNRVNKDTPITMKEVIKKWSDDPKTTMARIEFGSMK